MSDQNGGGPTLRLVVDNTRRGVEYDPEDLQLPVTVLNVPTRVQHRFSEHDVRLIGELVQLRPDQLLSWYNFGRKSLKYTREALRVHGLCLHGD